MQLWQQLAASICVGVVWGITNPVSRIGSRRAARGSLNSSGVLGKLAAYISTPLLVLPQIWNIATAAAFAAVVRVTPLSLAVPVANGASLLVSVSCDHILGEILDLWLVLPGVACVVTGLVLCST